MSDYSYTKTFPQLDFETTIAKVTDALKAQGFGVLTEIDVKATLKKKLGLDHRPYKILGACNPELAHQALSGDPMIGVLLPCNAVVMEADGGAGTTVALINPKRMFELVENPDVAPIADQVDQRMRRVLEAIG